MEIFDFIFGCLNAFDYSISFIVELCRLPFSTAVGYIFNSSDMYHEFIFDTLITGYSASIVVPKIPILSEFLEWVFLFFWGWTPAVFGDSSSFAVCIILGTVGNVFIITLVHWAIKFIGIIEKPK